MAYEGFNGLDMSGVDLDTEDTVLDLESRGIHTGVDGFNLFEVMQDLDGIPNTASTHYDIWLRVGMALKQFGAIGLEAWKTWSARSPKHRDGVCEQKWPSFDRSEGDRVTPRSIAFLARQLEQEQEQPSKFQGMGLVDFLNADFRIDYIIDGILVEDQPLIVGGPKKALKTLTILEAGLALAHGVPFMGRYETKQRNVAIFSGESGKATLQERAKAMLLGMGIPQPDNDAFRIYDQLPHFGNNLDDFRRELERHKMRVAFVDPAFMCMNGTDAGNGFQMYEQLGNFTKACRDVGTTPCLAHHYTKAASQEFTPGDLSDLSWSGFAEWARQWWLLSRRSAYTDDGQHELFMRVGGSAGHSNLFYRFVQEGVQPNRFWKQEVRTKAEWQEVTQGRQKQEDIARIKEVLAESDEPLSQRALRQAARIGTRISSLLPELVDQGWLIKTNNGRYDYYQLAAEDK